MTETEENVMLSYREGSSDKVYQAHLRPQGGGWVVEFAYGRRGGALKASTKTDVPLPYVEAHRVYERLVAEKMAKGYTQDAGGVPFSGTEKAGRKTGNVPQLLNPVEDLEAVVLDDAFWAQEKFDGVRIMLERHASEVVGSNRLGLAVALPAPVAD